MDEDRTLRATLDERFAGDTLDPNVWFPYHLPHWSSRAASAATWSVRDGELHLTIPVDQPLWCPDLHEEPLRVSCIQSGSFAGLLGSTIGQMPFREGLVVREEEPTMWGYTPLYGHVEVRMRGIITARSLVAFYMSGIEDQPERAGEICVAEIFGDAIRDGSADVGIGVKKTRRSGADPGVRRRAARDRHRRVPYLRRGLAAGVACVHRRRRDRTPAGPSAGLPNATHDRRVRLSGQGARGRRRQARARAGGLTRARASTRLSRT
jgi:hypothetical protein